MSLNVHIFKLNKSLESFTTAVLEIMSFQNLGSLEVTSNAIFHHVWYLVFCLSHCVLRWSPASVWLWRPASTWASPWWLCWSRSTPFSFTSDSFCSWRDGGAGQGLKFQPRGRLWPTAWPAGSTWERRWLAAALLEVSQMSHVTPAASWTTGAGAFLWNASFSTHKC